MVLAGAQSFPGATAQFFWVEQLRGGGGGPHPRRTQQAPSGHRGVTCRTRSEFVTEILVILTLIDFCSVLGRLII